jgi:tetratricopeptide (TPR) repeat protein
MKAMKSNLVWGAAVLAVAAAACGGPAKTSKKEMSKLAASAPPPPSDIKPDQKIDRKVTSEARKDFAAAVEFYNQQAKEGWNQERCTAAARRFQRVASDHDKVVEARFNAGLSFHNCRMLTDAEQEYLQALRIKSGHARSLSALGEIYYSGGNVSRGEEYWRKAIEADPKTVAARNNLAWLLLNKMRETSDRGAWKKYEEEAKGNLSRVLAVDSDNIEAYVLYALVYMEGSDRNKSRLDLANLLLEEGAKRNADFAPLWNARGLLQLLRDNIGRALSMFERAVQINPQFVEARMNVGNIVLGFRKYDVAKEQFEAVLAMQPKNYDAILGKGIALRGLGDLKAAEATYTVASQLDSRKPEAYFNLGLLYKDFYASQATDEGGAIGAFKKAREYFNQYVAKGVSKKAASEAQEHIEDCDKAVKQLEQAIEQKKQMEAIQKQAAGS